MTFPSDVAHTEPARLIDPVADPEWRWVPQVPPTDPMARAPGGDSCVDGTRGLLLPASSVAGGLGRGRGDDEEDDKRAESEHIAHIPPFVDPAIKVERESPSSASINSAFDRARNDPILNPRYVPPFSIARHADLDLTRMPTNFIPIDDPSYEQDFSGFNLSPSGGGVGWYAPSIVGSTTTYRSKGTKAAKLTARAGTIWSMGGAFSEEIEPPKVFYLKSEKKYRGGGSVNGGGGGGGGGSVYGGGSAKGGKSPQPKRLGFDSYHTSHHGGGSLGSTSKTLPLPRFVSPEDPSSMSKAMIMGWGYGRDPASMGNEIMWRGFPEEMGLVPGAGSRKLAGSTRSVGVDVGGDRVTRSIGAEITSTGRQFSTAKRSFPEPATRANTARFEATASRGSTTDNDRRSFLPSATFTRPASTTGQAPSYAFNQEGSGTRTKLYHTADIVSKLGGDPLKAGTIHLIGYGMEIRAKGGWGRALGKKEIRDGDPGLGLLEDVEERDGEGSQSADPKPKPSASLAALDPLSPDALLLPSLARGEPGPKLVLIDGGDTQIVQLDSPPENDVAPGSECKTETSDDPFAFLYTAAKRGKINANKTLEQAGIIELPPSPAASDKFELVDGKEGSWREEVEVRVGNITDDGQLQEETTRLKEAGDTVETVVALAEPEKTARTTRKDGRLSLKDIMNAPLAEQANVESASSVQTLAKTKPAEDESYSTIPQSYPHSLHPDHTLISWIHIIPDAHPNFTPDGGYELWFHTSSEVVHADPRNVGRPIPVFGLEKGFVPPGMRNAGMQPTGLNARGSGALLVRNGKTVGPVVRNTADAGAMKVAYMGWWTIKTFQRVEPESQELLAMLSEKEQSNNYGANGRTVAAWHRGLSQQRWVKVNMEKYVPAVGGRKLVNPMEARWDLAIDEVERRQHGPKILKGDEDDRPVEAVLTECGETTVQAGSDSSASPTEDGMESTQTKDIPRTDKPSKRFERIIGWENYVREVIEEAQGGVVSLLA